MNDQKPELLLHVCCAPCSSVPIKRLSEQYNILGYFYNPNIFPVDEYNKRKDETEKYFCKLNIPFITGKNEYNLFNQKIQGLEKEPERGKRCDVCFRIRLQASAEKAIKNDILFFCTTLTISPHKSSTQVNAAGEECQVEGRIKFLSLDFKKNNGYKESLDISRENNFYRQSYCGCRYSQRNS